MQEFCTSKFLFLEGPLVHFLGNAIKVFATGPNNDNKFRLVSSNNIGKNCKNKRKKKITGKKSLESLFLPHCCYFCSLKVLKLRVEMISNCLLLLFFSIG